MTKRHKPKRRRGRVVKVVVTGGPCGGKSTALDAIAVRVESFGWKVLVKPEGATLAILNRMSPANLGVPLFQRSLLQLELDLDANFQAAAETLAADGHDVLVLCDRAWHDGVAYTKPQSWRRHVRETEALARAPLASYDGVVHLVTAADGAREFYTLANNEARFETPEQAVATDVRLRHAYQQVEHWTVIGNEHGWERKLFRAVEAVCGIVGLPQPFEIERKFDVEGWDAAQLRRAKPVLVDVVQFYAPDGMRYRRRTLPDGTMTFSRTHKIEVPGKPAERIEATWRIDASDFRQAEMEHPNAPHVRKSRHCFEEGHYRWELDVFRKPAGVVLLEVEMPTADENPPLPSWIRVRREVTDDPAFRNFELANRG